MPKSGSPFDDIFLLVINHKAYDDPDDEEILEEPFEQCESTEPDIATTNTALNVLRLTGRYMHIMYLLRPISHDVIKALMELFDYYFFTIYRFFAVDALNTTWLSTCISSMAQANLSQTIDFSLQANSSHQSAGTTGNKPFAQISTELKSFIRRINDTLILNESIGNSTLNNSASIVTSASTSSIRDMSLTAESQTTSPNGSPKRLIKYPSPMLPDYVPINEPASLFALPERIMAIESLLVTKNSLFVANLTFCFEFQNFYFKAIL